MDPLAPEQTLKHKHDRRALASEMRRSWSLRARDALHRGWKASRLSVLLPDKRPQHSPTISTTSSSCSRDKITSNDELHRRTKNKSLGQMISFVDSPEVRQEFCFSIVGIPSSYADELCQDNDDSRLAGVGKSSVCARFVYPSHDEYAEVTKADSSVVSDDEFDSLTVAPPHCVGYGPVLKPVAGKEVVFRLIEHTTLRDDRDRVHRLSGDYMERATSLSISGSPVRVRLCSVASKRLSGQSSAAASIAVENEFLPQNSELAVGGFVLVLDTTRQGVHEEDQLNFLERLAAKLALEGKDSVLALTKLDAVSSENLQRILTKVEQRQHLHNLPAFQVSASVGVGVEDVFFGLYRQASAGSCVVLSTLSHSVLSEAHGEAISLALAHFKAFLRQKQNDFSTTWEEFVRGLDCQSTNGFRPLAALWALKGRDACKRAFLERLVQLKYSDLLKDTDYTESLQSEREKLWKACEGHPDLRVHSTLDNLLQVWFDEHRGSQGSCRLSPELSIGSRPSSRASGHDGSDNVSTVPTRAPDGTSRQPSLHAMSYYKSAVACALPANIRCTDDQHSLQKCSSYLRSLLLVDETKANDQLLTSGRKQSLTLPRHSAKPPVPRRWDSLSEKFLASTVVQRHPPSRPSRPPPSPPAVAFQNRQRQQKEFPQYGDTSSLDRTERRGRRTKSDSAPSLRSFRAAINAEQPPPLPGESTCVGGRPRSTSHHLPESVHHVLKGVTVKVSKQLSSMRNALSDAFTTVPQQHKTTAQEAGVEGDPTNNIYEHVGETHAKFPKSKSTSSLPGAFPLQDRFANVDPSDYLVPADIAPQLVRDQTSNGADNYEIVTDSGRSASRSPRFDRNSPLPTPPDGSPISPSPFALTTQSLPPLLPHSLSPLPPPLPKRSPTGTMSPRSDMELSAYCLRSESSQELTPEQSYAEFCLSSQCRSREHSQTQLDDVAEPLYETVQYTQVAKSKTDCSALHSVAHDLNNALPVNSSFDEYEGECMLNEQAECFDGGSLQYVIDKCVVHSDFLKHCAPGTAV